MSFFPCSGCGVCCKRVGDIIAQAKKQMEAGNNSEGLKEYLDFPYKYDETGKCEMLGEDNKCRIYEKRPRMCNLKQMWKHHYKHIDKKVYIGFIAGTCNKMMDMDKVDYSFRIKRISN